MGSHNPFVPSRYGHPNFSPVAQKSRLNSFGGHKSTHQRLPAGTNNRNDDGSNKSSRRRQKNDDSKLSVMPEDDDCDEFSNKHLAAARFHRNHRLISELFDDQMVPEAQPKIAPDRINLLRKQVQALSMHQKKLENELVELQDKFNAKRTKIIDSGRSFLKELEAIK